MKIKIEWFYVLLVAIATFTVWKSSTFISIQNEGQVTNNVDVVLQSLLNHVSNGTNQSRGSVDTNPARKPHFILHIGPPKTATTFIQCNLQKLSEALSNDDSYYFVGKNCPGSSSYIGNNETSIPGHFLIMGLNDANTHNRGYEALKSRMNYHHLKGNNIIYSNEGLANHLIDQNLTWNCLQSMLTGWDVRVVIGYRHYFDWIRSFYYQTNKQHSRLEKKWPNQGNGRRHPSFISFLEYHLQRKESGNLSIDGGVQSDAFGHHLTITAYKKYSSYFDNVQLLNLYNDENIMTDFICRILPDAGKTCHRLRFNEDIVKEEHNMVNRASQSFDAHRISEAAFDRGLISKGSPKEVVVKMVSKKLEETGVKSLSMFLTCPSSSLASRVLDVSINYEIEMLELTKGKVSKSEKNRAKAAHVSMYRNNEAKNRFCDLDPELLLNNRTWVKILSTIGEITKVRE